MCLDGLTDSGMRVLGIAAKWADEDRDLTPEAVENGLSLIGLIGLIDPPREEAIAAIASCRAAGIQVKMITGDHALTARAIARDLGLGGGRTLTGADLDRIEPADFVAAIEGADVFARTSPEHKLMLVAAMQRAGDVVAMTGDGVNDAPALKRADVGVAMGRKGTEAAKEAAAIVLADDNFASIAHAVEEGRTVYENIRKAILYILPTNGAEAAVLVAAIVFGFAIPITPVQILWVNMVTETLLSMVIAFEPAVKGIMMRPPRPPKEALLSRFLVWRTVLVTALLAGGVVWLHQFELGRGMSEGAARAAAVNALVLGEIFYLFNMRHMDRSSFQRDVLFGNRYALPAVGALLLLQLAFTYLPPMQKLFGTAAMDAKAWLLCALVGAAVFVVVEIEKAWMSKSRKRNP